MLNAIIDAIATNLAWQGIKWAFVQLKGIPKRRSKRQWENAKLVAITREGLQQARQCMAYSVRVLVEENARRRSV